MAVIVDEPGRDGAALGVDRAVGGAAQFADLDDLAVLDADIAPKSRHSRAVDDKAILDQQIVRHRYSPWGGDFDHQCSASRGSDTLRAER